MQKIIIPITEFDVEMFKQLVKGKNEEPMNWQYPTDKGEEVEIEFVKSED